MAAPVQSNSGRPDIHGTMTSTGNKKEQEAGAWKEISKRRQLRDELELDNSSCSEVQYDIETSKESLVVTTRPKSKAQEAAAATASPSQFDEGSDEAMSNGDNPPVDNAEEGNDDAEESSDDNTDVEDSDYKESASKKSNEQGSISMKKGNPSSSIQDKSKIQINSLNEVPELKRLFEGYNIYWMAKTTTIYNMEMVHEFYANYYCTLEKKAPSNNVVKKMPVLDSVRVRAILVDISKRTISMVLMGGNNTVPTRTTEYDYQMEAMKGIKKWST
ncbi:hypothetical protein HAX54_040155 [Datura stramonium]|uniref:Uncharacterized protein n=1 Tax=Datura stramonium TaxID=4076 RepID=A0ABS8VS13_DATST|nr:hypothetical protein [Datura stramonium]